MSNTQNTKTSYLPLFNKINRIAAWILFVTIITYGITGYGMTKGIISPNLARTLHFNLLGAVGLTAFTIHTSWSIYLSLRRSGLWNKISKIGFAGCYLILIGFFVYLHFFY